MSTIISSLTGLAVTATPLKDAVRFHLGGGSVNASAVVMAWDLPIPADFRLVPADAIVIERSDLPEVADLAVGCSGYVQIGDRQYVMSTVEFYDNEIRNMLALREHEAARTAVDEVQVLLLSEVLADTRTSHIDLDEQARRLYLAGVRIEAAK